MKTLGEFYKERVLSLPETSLIKRELPDNSGEVKIERDLFGWKLYSGKNFIECTSEEEARYLKIFLDAGLKEVYVPPEEQLKELLSELESLKEKIDKIINFYIDGILDYKIREKIRNEVYREITSY
jgi:hypothetical protein